jgi:hypothetical protein
MANSSTVIRVGGAKSEVAVNNPGASSSTMAMTYPPGININDLIFVFVYTDPGMSTPSGYTSIGSLNDGGATSTIYAFAKLAAGTESGTTLTLTIPVSAGVYPAVATMTVLRSTIVPFTSVAACVNGFATGLNGAGGSTTVWTGPQLTNVPAGSWLMSAGFNYAGLAGAPVATITGTNWNVGTQKNLTIATYGSYAIAQADNAVDSGSANQPTITWSVAGVSGNYIGGLTFYVYEPIPIAFASDSQAGCSAAATNYTVFPSLATEGDIMLFFLGTNGGTNLTAPGGTTPGNNWVLLEAPTNGSCWYRVCDGQEPTGTGWNFSWTSSVAFAWALLHFTFNNRQWVLLPEAHSSQANVSSTNLVAPAITPFWNNDLLVNCYIGKAANAITPPAGQTSLKNLSLSGMSILAASEPLASNASTGTRTATATAEASICFSVAIRYNFVTGTQYPWGQLLPNGYDSVLDIPANRAGALPGIGPSTLLGFGPSFGFSGDGSIVNGSALTPGGVANFGVATQTASTSPTTPAIEVVPNTMLYAVFFSSGGAISSLPTGFTLNTSTGNTSNGYIKSANLQETLAGVYGGFVATSSSGDTAGFILGIEGAPSYGAASSNAGDNTGTVVKINVNNPGPLSVGNLMVMTMLFTPNSGSVSGVQLPDGWHLLGTLKSFGTQRQMQQAYKFVTYNEASSYTIRWVTPSNVYVLVDAMGGNILNGESRQNKFGRAPWSTPRLASEPYDVAGQSQGYTGTASISGTAVLGSLLLKRVWLYLSPMTAPSVVIAAAFTNADGTFSFTGLAPGKYMIEGYDPSGTYNGDIITFVTAY